MNKRFFSRERWGVLSFIAGFALLLAACQPAPTPTQAPTVTAPTTAPTTASAAGASTAAQTMIQVATDAKLGQILVDGRGMTLYQFTKDQPGQSNCADQCLKAWPPLLESGPVQAGSGIDAAQIGTASLADGSKIVTYHQMPLYYWAGDKNPGDTTGQNVNNVWFVVSPSGEMVGAPSVPVTGDSGATGTGAPTAAPTMSADSTPTRAASGSSAAGEVQVRIAQDPTLGPILVDGAGRTLYLFTKDQPGQSNCTGQCLQAWPPLITQGSPQAGAGVDAAQLGSVALADGRRIVTYHQKPLYYWAGDTAPGDATGQGVNGVWFVVTADGNPVGAGTSMEDNPSRAGADDHPGQSSGKDDSSGKGGSESGGSGSGGSDDSGGDDSY
jgi:predicted lipoprotein with Yx(FWY)xxD motif